MKVAFALTLFIISSYACTGPKKATPTAIGVVTLYNYVLNPDVSFNDEIHYAFINNADDFHKMFNMTRSAPGSAVVPDFASQAVVAVILQPTTKVISLAINKGVITGNELKIYYTITDTTSWKSYQQRPTVVATVPKSNDVKQVSFYSNGLKEKTLPAS